MQKGSYEEIAIGDDIDTVSGGWPINDVLDQDMHGPARISVDDDGDQVLELSPENAHSVNGASTTYYQYFLTFSDNSSLSI